jgi:hypothetical protein
MECQLLQCANRELTSGTVLFDLSVNPVVVELVLDMTQFLRNSVMDTTEAVRALFSQFRGYRVSNVEVTCVRRREKP